MSEPTTTELFRTLNQMQDTLLRIEDRMLPRAEWSVANSEVKRRLDALEAGKTEAHREIFERINRESAVRLAEIAKVYDRINTDKKEEDDRDDAQQQWSREMNARIWLAIMGGVIAFCFSVFIKFIP